MTKIKKELERDSLGKYIWQSEFNESKIKLIALHRPEDFHFTMEVSNNETIILSWKGLNGNSDSSQQDFRHCQNMLRAWLQGIKKIIDRSESALNEARVNREILENSTQSNDVQLDEIKPNPSDYKKIHWTSIFFTLLRWILRKWKWVLFILGLIMVGFFLRTIKIQFDYREINMSWDERAFWLVSIAIAVPVGFFFGRLWAKINK
ncbi:MAG: hypothetical protein RIC88_01270 [Ekhidna sp.]